MKQSGTAKSSATPEPQSTFFFPWWYFHSVKPQDSKQNPTSFHPPFQPTVSLSCLHPLPLSLLCLLEQHCSEADAPVLWARYGIWVPPSADDFVTHQMLFWSSLSQYSGSEACRRTSQVKLFQAWVWFKRSSCHKQFLSIIVLINGGEKKQTCTHLI